MDSSIPSVFILFGATGDLAERKIMPALLALYEKAELPKNFRIIAFSRRPWLDKEYHAFIRPALENKNTSSKIVDGFLKTISYVSGTFDDPQGYENLKKTLQIFQGKASKINAVCHFAVEPQFYATVAHGLAKAGLNKKVKIMLEKPFGSDYASAKKLRDKLETSFSEQKIYHVDHYLAKHGIQNLVEIRKTDKKFESLLTKKDVESVGLFLMEEIGIEDRGRFYDRVGALRDVGQNHLMEMLMATTMELPKTKNIKALRNARLKVLKSLKLEKHPMPQFGQYEGYKKESDVKSTSETETFFSFTASLNLRRYRGVPFYVQSGKYLRERKGIEIRFKNGVVKEFPIERTEAGHAEAYRILIKKIFAGDMSFFVGIDELLAEWKIIDAVLKKKKTTKLFIYEKGSSDI